MTIQLLQILLLLGQVFFAPYFIGGLDFSKVLFLIAPAMLIQGFYEPVCQAFFSGASKYSIRLPTVIFFVIALSFYAIAYSLSGFSDFSGFDIFLALIYCVVYLFQTLLFSSLYSRGEGRVIVYSLLLGVFSYYLFFFILIALGFRFYAYIAANLVFVLTSSVWALHNVSISRFMAFFCDGVWSVRALAILFFALVRVPVISLNTLFVLILGFFAWEWRVVVAYKLLTSAVNALKYTSPMPSGKFYVMIVEECSAGELMRFLSRKSVIFNLATQSLAAVFAIFIFPFYWSFLYPEDLLPEGWWLVIFSGVAFQVLQPFLMLVNIRLGMKSLCGVLIVFFIVAVFSISVDPFVAFATSVWVTLAVSVFLLSKPRQD